MNIAHIEEQSFIYGPGCRYVIWTQGCSIRCKDCWNKEMWSFNKKNEISINELFKKIIAEKEYIEGVTILGGEPFDQYDELLSLIKQIRKTDLSIILYTGYSQNELKDKNKTEILDYIDIIITDRYDKNYRTENGGLIGSSNQKIIFLTNRYSKNDLSKNNEIEISINENGQINMYGYPYDYKQQTLAKIIVDNPVILCHWK